MRGSLETPAAPSAVSPEQREALTDLFVADLRAKVNATDDPHCVIWLALHAGAAIVGDLGSFDREGIRTHDPVFPRR